MDMQIKAQENLSTFEGAGAKILCKMQPKVTCFYFFPPRGEEVRVSEKRFKGRIRILHAHQELYGGVKKNNSWSDP